MPNDDAMQIALENFDLDSWCRRHGFTVAKFGEEFVHDCPWCLAEGKLSVNPILRKWRCFRCQRRFVLTDLVAEFEGSFHEAIRVILAGGAPRQLGEIPEMGGPRATGRRRPDWDPEPIRPPPYFHPLESHTEYTARRGFDLEYLKVLGVGICTDGWYADRLVFPCRRDDGQWLYFQTRAMWEASEQTTGKYRKNLNPKTEDPERQALASDVLLGVELLKPYGISRIALVEGPTDWAKVGPGAVASFGKVISDRQITLMIRAGVSEVDLMWDPDAWVPPKRADRPSPAEAAAKRLSSVFTLRVVRYPPGFDPGDYTPAQNGQWRAAAMPYSDGGSLGFIP